MWDYVLLVSTLALTPGILPVIFHKDAYVPRLSSGMFVVGIAGIALALFMSGLYLGAGANAMSTLEWAFVFTFRGRRPNAH